MYKPDSQNFFIEIEDLIENAFSKTPSPIQDIP